VGLAILLSLAARTQVLTPPRPCCATNDYICASAICPLWVIYRYSGALPSPDAGQCPRRTARLSSPACLSCKQDHTMNQAPELLAPAGTLKAMRFAFAYGADAVYAGQPRYSLRVRENDFHDPAVLAEAIAEAHALGRKFYLASNISAHNN